MVRSAPSAFWKTHYTEQSSTNLPAASPGDAWLDETKATTARVAEVVVMVSCMNRGGTSLKKSLNWH